MNDIHLFDTDMFIHRLSSDAPVKNLAQRLFDENTPNAICSFSLVELKGNYVQCLILLRRKIIKSSNIAEAANRIQSSGGRKTLLMFAQFFSLLCQKSIITSKDKWDEMKNILITLIDSNIEIVWHEFKNLTSTILDTICCTRSTEDPIDTDGDWHAAIPKCYSKNTSCKVDDFITQRIPLLKNFISYYDKLPEEERTDELNKIRSTANSVISNSKFNWQGSQCRRVGDLIIAIQSIDCIKLISSNRKEHSHLSNAFGYNFLHFNHSEVRSK